MAKKKEAEIVEAPVRGKKKIAPESEEVSSGSTDIVIKPNVKELSFDTNFAAVKKELEEKIKKFKKFKVTDANFEEAKAVKKQFVSMRTAVETSKKDAIAMYIAPPKAFLESRFAELASLVKQGEELLDSQLDVFEQERIADLTKVLNKYKEDLQKEYALPEEFLSDIEFPKSYFNKTAKEAETRKAIKEQFEEAKKRWEAKKGDIELIKKTCGSDKRLNVELYIKQLDFGRTVSAICSDIETEKVRLQEITPPYPDAVKVGASTEPVERALGARKKLTGKLKTMRVELSFDSSLSDDIKEFFEANGIKAKKID